jgi:hypothetical protein
MSSKLISDSASSTASTTTKNDLPTNSTSTKDFAAAFGKLQSSYGTAGMPVQSKSKLKPTNSSSSSSPSSSSSTLASTSTLVKKLFKPFQPSEGFVKINEQSMNDAGKGTKGSSS